VFQFTDTAFQWYFKAFAEFKHSFSGLRELSVVPFIDRHHDTSSWFYEVLVTSNETWAHYCYLLFIHTACEVV